MFESCKESCDKPCCTPPGRSCCPIFCPKKSAAGQKESFIDEVLEAGGEELYAESLAMLEKYLFTRVLNHTRGNQSQAAKILGITRGSLRNKIRLLKISIGQVVSVEEEEDADEDQPAAPVASHADVQ